MKSNELRAMAHGGMAAAVFIAVATIASEESSVFKAFLAGTFWHHWIGKGILALVVFGLVYLIQKNRVSNAKVDMLALMRRLVIVFVLSGALIFGFFVWELLAG